MATADSLPSVVRACNLELAWGLSDERLHRLAAAVRPFVAPDEPATQIRTVVLNYVADHASVEALRDELHRDHQATWAGWMRQVVGVLRRAGMAWSDDPAIDLEDLAQVARAELARALPGYAYQSRLSSWAYRVVVQSVTRQIRRARAEKRAARPASLERIAPEVLPHAPMADPDVAARGRLLAERVAAVLAAQADRRLLGIFQQWALEDRATAEIGALVQLHPSRVRALLAEARQALRADPVIRAWHDGVELRNEAA